MKRMWVLLTAVVIWAGFAPARSVAQQDGPVVGVSDVVAVSVEWSAVIGTAPDDLADIGFAYYEIVDDFGVLDYGYLPVLQDGSYRAYLTANVQQGIIGEPLLLLYQPLDGEFSGPVQVNYMMGGDSVSATFTRIMATGDSAAIRSFLQLMKETGQLTAQQTAALEARLLVVEAAELVASEIAAAEAAQLQAITAANATAIRGAIMRAFFKHGFKPVVNATTKQAMKSYLKAARDIIAKYKKMISDGGRTPKQVADLERNIAEQESRITQIFKWFNDNGISP